MQFLRIRSNEKKMGGFALATILFLLTLYLLGTVEMTSFHALLHTSSEEVELHSKVNESNACHQSVYHNKKEQGCEHRAHIIVLKKCPLCHLSLQSFHLFTAKQEIELTISSALAREEAHTSTIGEVLSLIPARAPPVA